MDIKTKETEIICEITQIKKDVIKLRNEKEEETLNHERQIDALINEIILIIDAFEKSEAKVKNSGLYEEESIQKVVRRMLAPKKVANAILDKYNVKQIDILGMPVNEDLCAIVETEPDLEKEDGTVISIEKNGYTRDGHLIRRAEVVTIRN